MSQKISDFEKIKLAAEDSYNNFGEIYCPFFKEKIVFNSLGLEHLKFKKHGKARLEQDQSMRFKLLHLAPIVISLSGTLQGIRITKSFEETKINNRWEYILKEITYYEFIAIVEHHRVRIILKQIENGIKFFWSIIPASQVSKKEIED